MQNPFLDLGAEVREALATAKPVVALESTIIAHGMPYPQNLETAVSLEATVRAEGAVPATVAVIDGRLKVGLSQDELTLIAQSRDVRKVSRRDLPYALAHRCLGATTVSGTMIAADLAGIRIFVTGGIGGVHRGGETTMDVSADLLELAHTSVAVICAGAKAILDLGRTLEVLETHGVPVIGYGTDEFPAFYTRQSGFGVDCRLDSPAEVAQLLDAKWKLGLTGGAVVAVPLPEEAALDCALVEQCTTEALALAEQQGIHGKQVTPFLLAAVSRLTGGKSLAANIALVRNNARVGAQIARAYARCAPTT